MRGKITALILVILRSSLSFCQSADNTPEIKLFNSVACTPVKDQSSSPTCWVFGTHSLFESDLLKKTNLELDLSEMYIARYAYIDKINAYLASGGKTYCEGGGQFQDVLRVINRYGIVPEEVYTGRPYKEIYHNHARLDTAVKRFFNRLLKEGKKEIGVNDLVALNSILDKYLGAVPKNFVFKNKLYTPKSFAKEILPFSNEYVDVMSFDSLAYYQRILLGDKFNWAGDSLYNIPLYDFQELVDTALANGWSVGWEGDVTEKGFSFISGFAQTEEDGSMMDYNKQRITDFKSEQTERDHMLHIVGAGRDEQGKKWYYLKNSWGVWFSKFKGYIYMSEDYFRRKTVVLLVNKEGLPQGLKEKLGIKH